MFWLFNVIKFRSLDYLSYELLEILRPNIGAPNPHAAKEFIENNQNNEINFYLTKKYDGVTISIIKCCIVQCAMILRSTSLLDSALHHPSLKNAKHHDWETVYNFFNYLISNLHKDPIAAEMFFKLKSFYQPLISNAIQDQEGFEEIQDIPFEKVSNFSFNELFDYHFSDFPSSEIWRLFVDGNLQNKENGWLDYELREPGSIMGMLNGLEQLKKEISKPLTPEILINLHVACTQNVNLKVSPGKFRNGSIDFGFIFNQNISIAGLFELLDNEKLEDYVVTYLPHRELLGLALKEEKVNLLNANSVEEYLYQKITRIFNEYNQSMSKCTNNIEKLNLIIGLIVLLERCLHPFQDANCRTICILLLNRELIKNGFSPVILYDPNRFDGYTKNELFNEIIHGMDTFKKAKHGDTFSMGAQNKDIYYMIKQQPEYASCFNTWEKLSNYTLY